MHQYVVDRDEQTSWGTPRIVEAAGRTQVIVNASNRVRSYDLANGEVIWECGGQTVNAIPSPLVYGDNAIVMSGFRGSAIYSIPLDSKGDLTDSEKLAWHHDGKSEYRAGTPYVPSALLYGDHLYFLKSNDAILTCMSARDGKVAYDKKRLERVRQVYASPVGAAGRVYIVGRDGTTAVLKQGAEFELLATNDLGESIDASPALVGNEIFLRGKQHLYCIGEK
jgi:outer membrane protein assembly factor BamB